MSVLVNFMIEEHTHRNKIFLEHKNCCRSGWNWLRDKGLVPHCSISYFYKNHCEYSHFDQLRQTINYLDKVSTCVVCELQAALFLQHSWGPFVAQRWPQSNAPRFSSPLMQRIRTGGRGDYLLWPFSCIWRAGNSSKNDVFISLNRWVVYTHDIYKKKYLLESSRKKPNKFDKIVK